MVWNLTLLTILTLLSQGSGQPGKDWLRSEVKFADEDPICFVTGQCDGEVINVIEDVFEQFYCLTACQETSDCTWFTHVPSESLCILYKSCPAIDESCGQMNECVSGESRCEGDSPWHMTIGGSNGTIQNSVELYNWKTGQQCFIEPLPQAIYGHSGTLMNGDPVVCGGVRDYQGKTDCFQYQRDTKKWKKINDLMASTYLAASVRVPGKGWFIFGGNDVNASQKLETVDSSWEAGPAVQTPEIYGQCIVQINETATAFIGGTVNPKNIYIYDWSSPNPNFVLQSETLAKKRYFGACGLVANKDGESVVAIIGGNGSRQKGMELWNPQTKTVELLWDIIPPEENGMQGYRESEMVTLNGGREFLLYGGYQGTVKDSIWKYTVTNNTWESIGSLLSARYSHVSLAVHGVGCP